MAWREVWRSHDLAAAQAVATALLSMEYAVTLRASDGSEVTSLDSTTDDSEDGRSRDLAPFIVEVEHEHWADLVDLVDEIAHEQIEFDERVARRAARRCRSDRLLLAVVVAVVIALAIIGGLQL